jgi:hypothetical protein
MHHELQNVILAQVAPSALEQARKAVQKADEVLNLTTNKVAGSQGVGGLTWTPELVQKLTLAVLAFGGLVLVLMTVLLYRRRESGAQILRCFGVVLIVCLSAILLVVGYSNEQLTPIVGLFGAIAGYLLGKDSNTGSSGEDKGNPVTQGAEDKGTSPAPVPHRRPGN